MTIKYAILSTHGGLPVTSFDFQEGGLPIDEILFTGFMSAIQAFMTDFKEQKDSMKNHGEIKTGNWHILFNKGKLLLGILVGENLEQNELNKMTKAQFNLEKILLSDSISNISNPSDINSQLLSNFSIELLKNFEREFIQDYFIPTVQSINLDADPITLLPEFWNFTSVADGKRDLTSISNILQTPIEDCRFLAIELFNRKLLHFNVRLHDSTILRLTVKGTKAILSEIDLSTDLTGIWKTLVQPFLSLIDGKKNYQEVKLQLMEEIKISEDIYKVTKQMLFEGIVLPVSENYALGLELQKYYKHFYKVMSKKIGASGRKIFQEKADTQPDIKFLIPNFDNEELDMIQMEVLVETYGKKQMQDFVTKYVIPIQKSIDEYAKIFGVKMSNSLKSEMVKYRFANFDELITEFQLESILE